MLRERKTEKKMRAESHESRDIGGIEQDSDGRDNVESGEDEEQ